jgi:RHS repeat-associated protein
MILRTTSRTRSANFGLLLSIFLACSLSAVGQEQGQYDRGTPPQHAAGVSQLGSYTSADLGTVNLSNGALNVKLNIGSVGGRGFWLPLTLNWSSKIWSGKTDTDVDWGGAVRTVAFADFASGDEFVQLFNRIGPGWTVGTAPTIFVRIVRINQLTSGPNVGCYTYTVPKLTMMLPDKGEIEFRDDAYDGAPLTSDCSGYISASRGSRWHATDGSGTVFINDVYNGVAQGNVSGVAITSDGMRYHFSGNLCDSITDRNGNKITFQYTNGVEITDQLGRMTRIQQNVADPQNSGVTLALLVTLPGYNGQNRYYKVKSGIMNQHYRSDVNPTLPVITGDYDPLSYGYGWGSCTRLFNRSYGLYSQEIDDLDVLTELILPDNRSLHFNYNQFGEVAEVQMPTGGKVWYDYGYAGALPSGNSPVWERAGDLHTTVPIDRALTQRRTFPDGSTLEGTWNYRYNGSFSEVTAVSPSGSLMFDQRHFFLAAGRYFDYPPSSSGAHDGTQNTLWSTGVEWRTETRNAAGAVIAASEQDWTQRTPVVWSTYPQEQLANDNRVNEERKILDDGSTAKVQTAYQANVNYNNPSEVREYDFDQSLKRRTTTTYADGSNLINGLNYAADAIHLISLPLVQTVFDGNSNQVAQTVNEYDNYSNDGSRAPLQDYGSVTQHDPNYGTAYATRGNLTRLEHWLNTTNSFIYSYPRYDDLGNVTSAKDANGNVSTISYTDDFGDGSNPGGGGVGTYGATYAFPTLLTSPPPQSGQPQQTARSQYDFSTGLLTGFRDRNNIVTQTIYSDPFNRPTLVKAALGVTGVEAHTAIYYAQSAPTTIFGVTLTNNDVLTAKDQTNLDDATLRSWTHTDGFGRTIEAWSRDPSCDDKVATIYDALGRVKQVSNPYRPGCGENAIYTTTAYDLAGRVTSVTTPDSAVVATDYSGNRVLVRDQTGKERLSQTNALGQLTDVWEITAADSWTQSVSFPNHAEVTAGYRTSYTYDSLDDLLTVTQGTQPPRTFVYDSFKRLLSATNPESGLVCYGTLSGGQCQTNGYDANGNLLYRTDARGLLTSYTYDALNRVISKSYNDSNPQTPAVNYVYDAQSLPNGAPTFTRGASVGRLVAVTYGGGSSGDYHGYDATGRTALQIQQTGTVNYQVTVGSYDRAGHITSEVYPSGRTVSYTFDQAGRNNNFSGNLGDGVTRTYATGIIYDAASRLKKEQFGTDSAVFNKLWYNSRGQLAEIRDSTSYTDQNDTSWNRGAIINHYSDNCWGMCGGSNSTTNMQDNNGNLKNQDVYIPNNDQVTSYVTWRDHFDYDSLNRLLRAHEYPGDPQREWQQEYVYDRWGNRTIHQTNTWGPSIGPPIPKPNFGVDTTHNRLTPPAGYTMSYDSAGNLTNDDYTGQGQRIYDAENRMTQAWANNQWQIYTYDGAGHRVKRKVNNQETWQVYGMGGELVAEYAANAAPSNPQKEYGYRNSQLLVTATSTAGDVQWLVADQLGTPRMIFDKTGSLANTKRHDYLPFGEELTVGQGLRTNTIGYGADNVRQKFTQKERDSETGLDYFGARYYGSAQGRFTSADPLNIELRRLGDPQQLNLYSYTRNNPLRLTDPTGLDPDPDIQVTGQEQDEYLKRLQGELPGFVVGIDPDTNNVTVDTPADIPEGKAREYALDAYSRLTPTGQQLYDAIVDPINHATIDTGNGQPNPLVFFGRFDGGGHNTLDFSDINLLDAPANAGGITSTQVVAHETLEAYSSAKNPGSPVGPNHNFANQYAGGLDQVAGSGQPVWDNPATQANLVGATATFTVHGSNPVVREEITLHFVTPIPQAAISTTPSGSQPNNVVSVRKVP